MITSRKSSEWDFNLGMFFPYSKPYFTGVCERSKSRRIRKISQFAEEEIVLPTGPYAGRLFKMRRQPFARLWFKELENPWWNEFLGTGPSQSGKSLDFYVIPIMYELFERREDVIAASPLEEINRDKYERDLLPVIECSRFRDYLPKQGGGSRGAYNDRIDFLNGSTLKFMSGGGGDKSRSSFTAPVMVVTEVDGFKQLTTSKETGQIGQLEARQRATERDKRVTIKECTVTDEEGYIWEGIHNRGSASKILLRCPGCEQYVYLERMHLKGWQEAKTEVEVESNAAYHCPACDMAWTEKQRKIANLHAKLLHRGQSIDEQGNITGEVDTKTLGFRYSAPQNLLLPAKDIGYDEWIGARNEDEIDSEKKLTQFVWALPYSPPGLEQIKIDRGQAELRRMKYAQGQVPASTQWITVGVDIRKSEFHWVAIAWLIPERVGLIFDYGVIKLRLKVDGKWIGAKEIGFEQIYTMRVNEWYSKMCEGWVREDGESVDFDAMWIDSRWQRDQDDSADTTVVYDTITAWGDRRVLPIMGHSVNSYVKKKYLEPRVSDQNVTTRTKVRYHIRFVAEIGMLRCHIDVDAWKDILQSRLTSEPNSPGSLMLYDSKNPNEHQEILKHFASENRKRYWDKDKGETEAREYHREANHFLDAGVYACCAGHKVGFRVRAENDPHKFHPTPVQSLAGSQSLTGSVSRPYLASRR